MNEAEALQAIREFASSKYPNYPTDDLVAEAFESGWTVFPATDAGDVDALRAGQTIFLIGRDGRIVETSSSFPPGQAESRFVREFG